MRKICLLFSIILCCLSGFAQEFTVSPSTVESGGTVTVTGSGETSSAYFSRAVTDPTLITYSDGIWRNLVSIKSVTDIVYKDVYGARPTSFKMVVANLNAAEDYTVTLGIRVVISSATGQPTQTDVIKYITLTVKRAPTAPITYYNDAQSKVFYKNDCGAGFGSEPYTYPVPANKYSASTKAEANNKAQAEINANGQNTANANLACKQLYYNIAVTGVFRRNNCIEGQGSEVSTTIDPNRFSAFTQAEADAKAQTALNIEGQAKANAQGSCPIPTPYISSAQTDSFPRTNRGIYYVRNLSEEPGRTIVWSVLGNKAEIIRGQGENMVEYEFDVDGSIQITVTVSYSSGIVKTATKTVIVTPCAVCPLQ